MKIICYLWVLNGNKTRPSFHSKPDRGSKTQAQWSKSSTAEFEQCNSISGAKQGTIGITWKSCTLLHSSRRRCLPHCKSHQHQLCLICVHKCQKNEPKSKNKLIQSDNRNRYLLHSLTHKKPPTNENNTPWSWWYYTWYLLTCCMICQKTLFLYIVF